MSELTYDELKEFHGAMQTNLQMIPVMEHLFKFIEQTANGEGPVMSNLMIDFGTGDQKTLLKLWASAGLNSPMDRIGELREELIALKQSLAEARRLFGEIQRECADIRTGLRNDFPPTIGIIDNSFFVIADLAAKYLADNPGENI